MIKTIKMREAVTENSEDRKCEAVKNKRNKIIKD